MKNQPARRVHTLSTLAGFACAACAALGQAQPGPAPVPPPAQPGTPAEPVRTVEEWDLPRRGEKLAIKGYDPVAYFPEGGGKPLEGRKDITLEFRGVVYRFASAEHREAFRANPRRYEPAHGGWCSWAMREGSKTGPDPKSFIVKDDRLFLFYKGIGGDTRAQWLKTDHNQSAAEADSAWKRISREEKRQVKRVEPAAPPR